MSAAFARTLGSTGVLASLTFGAIMSLASPSADAQTVKCYKETCITINGKESCTKEQIDCPPPQIE